MDRQNILKGDYGDLTIIKVCLVLFLSVIIFACPFCVLPTKDSLEELFLQGHKKFTFLQNTFVTFGITLIAYSIAILVPTMGDAMTILGATTNSGIGFLLPIIFYLKVTKGEDNRKQRILAYVVFCLMSVTSCITMYTFINKKVNGGDSK